MLFDRAVIRERMRKELQKQLSGWGIWLETIEIQTVTISSTSYFKDLQENFRVTLHTEAEALRRKSDGKIKLRESEIETSLNEL